MYNVQLNYEKRASSLSGVVTYVYCGVSLTCGLHNAFQDHHNLKLLRLHGPQGKVIERAL